MVSQEAKKENPNSWKWAGPICLDLQREEPFTLISCWSGFWAYKAMVQTLAPEPWWILKGKCCFMSLLEAHQHLLSLPPHTFTYTFTVPFLCIILGGLPFEAVTLSTCFHLEGPVSRAKENFFPVTKSVYIMKKCENQYDFILLIATPSSLDWDIATIDSLIYILPFF